MELNEFAQNYPELYQQMDEGVRAHIRENGITGEMPLVEWDNMVDRIMEERNWDTGGQPYYGEPDPRYGQNRTEGYERGRQPYQAGPENAMPVQGRFDRDRFRPRPRRRRRRDGLDLRDILRLLFLRELFD